ncbi:MAG: hypothetical protein ACK55Z_06050 [bacterium]
MGPCLVDQSNLANLRVVRSGRLRGPRTRLYMAVLMRPSAAVSAIGGRR